jgi:hypothetical protein
MPMKRIRLELARDHEFPAGSRDRGYEFAAPLDSNGRLLADEWRKLKERWRVKRFWPGRKESWGTWCTGEAAAGPSTTMTGVPMTMSQGSNSTATTSFRANTFPSLSMTA